jgi:hypothetical protein
MSLGGADMVRILIVLVSVVFFLGCAVVPASYVPTTGKVGTQTGQACVFKLFNIIPFGDEMESLAHAADRAGNPTRDVAVINSVTWMVIGMNSCVTVRGNR